MRTLYLHEELRAEFKIPSTNNRIEGGVNACLRDMLHNHRGLSVERRIKAVFWWCYMHSPKRLSASEILKQCLRIKALQLFTREYRSWINAFHPSLQGAMLWSGESYTSHLNFRITGISN